MRVAGRIFKKLMVTLPAAGFTSDNSEVIVAGALFEGVASNLALPLIELAASGQICAMRNRAIAIKVARGEWIIQCDDDIILAPAYVAGICDSLDTADIVCTPLLNPNGTRNWDWAAFVPDKGQTLLPYDVEHKYI